MNPSIRTCYLFDEFGQQVGPFTVGETLRHLESAERQPGFRPRRLTVWTLGGLQVAERFTDGERPDLLAELIKQIARADRRIHRPLFQKASYLGRGDFREVFYRLIAEAIT
jgi:hypothetical protein